MRLAGARPAVETVSCDPQPMAANVLLIDGEGEKAEAVVNFGSVGEKRLLLSWAPLEKA